MENKEYIKNNIMNQSRHQFIYGYTNKSRTRLLKELESDYPVKINSNEPIALYLDTIGLPNVDKKYDNEFIPSGIAREYFNFLVAYRLIERSLELDNYEINSRLSYLINYINKSIKSDYKKIKTINDLLMELGKSRDYYLDVFINGGLNVDSIAIPFMQLDFFIQRYKEYMDINSYVGVIIDKKEDISIYSTRVINSYVGSRVNRDISVKVAVEPDLWDSYRTSNGELIQAVHDYGTLDIDSSNKEYTDRLIRQRS